MKTTLSLSHEELGRLVGSSESFEDFSDAEPARDGGDGEASGGRTGPLGLMLAVLEDAIRCIAERPINKREHVAVQARHAIRWVRSEDWSYVFSFNNVCTALDIDPDRMRRRLLEQPLDLAPGPMRLRRVENRPRRKRRARNAQGDEQSAA
jgi:hypothetical protein